MPRPVRIIYVARHDQSDSNDDEGAIFDALLRLGHDVQRLREVRGHMAYRMRGDLLLFHKWTNPDQVRMLRERRNCRAVFWYFDLVDWPADPTLGTRCQQRKRWMDLMVPRVDLGFCTDGDWVGRDRTGKLVHLTQGYDHRRPGWMGRAGEPVIPLLFTGGHQKCGRARVSFVKEMEARYGPAFVQVTHGVHGLEMTKLIGRARIVVAPYAPVTDYYASNRVYQTLGRRGFLLHPYSALVARQYRDGDEIVFYANRDDLHAKIERYGRPEMAAERERIAENGFRRTMREHLYIHRVTQMLDIIRARLGLT